MYLSYKFQSSLDSSLDFSRRKSLRGNHICTASQYKSILHFPSQNNWTCTRLTNKQQLTLIKPVGFFPSFNFQFHFDQISSTKVT